MTPMLYVLVLVAVCTFVGWLLGNPLFGFIVGVILAFVAAFATFH